MKAKEKELLPDEELFSAILEVSSEAIWVRDFKKNMAYWLASAKNREKYGLPSAFIEDNFWQENIHPDDRENAVNGYNEAFANPDIHVFVHQYRFIGQKSIEYLIQDHIKFIRHKGKVIRVTGVWRDQTDDYGGNL